VFRSLKQIYPSYLKNVGDNPQVPGYEPSPVLGIMTTLRTVDNVHSFDYCFFTSLDASSGPVPHEVVVTNMLNSSQLQYSQFEVSMPMHAGKITPPFDQLSAQLLNTPAFKLSDKEPPQALTELETYYSSLIEKLESENQDIGSGIQKIAKLKEKIEAKRLKKLQEDQFLQTQDE